MLRNSKYDDYTTQLNTLTAAESFNDYTNFGL
jgi:hypothetical protein